MRSQLRDRLGELVAAMPPAELRVGNIAAAAIGEAEILFAGIGKPVQLVVRLVLR